MKKYQESLALLQIVSHFWKSFLFFCITAQYPDWRTYQLFLFFEKILIYMYYVTVYSAMLLHFVINTSSRNILIFSIIGFIRNKYDEKKYFFCKFLLFLSFKQTDLMLNLKTPAFCFIFLQKGYTNGIS